MKNINISGTQTLEKALVVLEYIVDNKATNLTKLSKSLGMHKSTVYRHLVTFKKMGYITQDENDAYLLTDKLLKMATGVVPQMEIRNIAIPYINQLANITSHNTSFGFWNKTEILYLAQKRVHPVDSLVVGETIPAYCSALGKAILAYLPEIELFEYLEKTTFIKYAEKTVLSKTQFIQELEDVKRTGYAIVADELLDGLYGVSVPIFTDSPIPQYAVSVSGSTQEMEKDLNKIIIHLKSIAEQISDKVKKSH